MIRTLGGNCNCYLNLRSLTVFLEQARAYASGDVSVPLTHPTYQIWGSNTDVGKTLVSAGIFKQACERSKALFLKPVQTGFPQDSDARLVGHVAGVGSTLGEHAAQLDCREADQDPAHSGSCVHTEFAWQTPVSPHLAVELEGRSVGDETILREVTRKLWQHANGGTTGLALVETAGGPASPGPSGSLQCNMFRPLRLPALLVGDGKLGGISQTLAAYEMLSLRGYDVAAIALLEPEEGPNTAAIEGNVISTNGSKIPVVRLPLCSPREGGPTEGGVDPQLQQWLQESRSQLCDLLDYLYDFHEQRVTRLGKLAEKTLSSIWYPFTQHQGLSPKDITVIDGRSGEDMLVHTLNQQEGQHQSIEAQFDACASWWTQGMAGELHGKLVRETLKGVARYGHVIHPHTATEPTLQLAELLLSSVGRGWASRVFYSDNGSTAVEVALKMAFRKFWHDHPEVDLVGQSGRPLCELRVLGIDGGYHGDTLGAMDAVAPSPYNGPAQFPWYKGRGVFLQAPYVGLARGRWRLKTSDGESWASFEELLQAKKSRESVAQRYKQEIGNIINTYEAGRLENGATPKVATCIIEPVLQGAGGMLVVDPLYQQCLVQVARQRRIPVIFDEVFGGLWRLGRVSAAEILDEQPDIACYAKLLTGGLLPMSATLASSSIFNAFQGDTKLEALLHGHSYSGHIAGACAGVAALSIFADPHQNPAMQPSGGELRELWPADLMQHVSHLPGVDSVIALGTVFAVELSTADGGGYASGASAKVVTQLRARGIFARPLGNTVYLMVTPTTLPGTARRLLQTLVSVLEQPTIQEKWQQSEQAVA